MTEQQKPLTALQAPPEEKVEAKATPKGVKMTRRRGQSQETVTALKPSTVTRLKSEGWVEA